MALTKATATVIDVAGLSNAMDEAGTTIGDTLAAHTASIAALGTSSTRNTVAGTVGNVYLQGDNRLHVGFTGGFKIRNSSGADTDLALGIDRTGSNDYTAYVYVGGTAKNLIHAGNVNGGFGANANVQKQINVSTSAPLVGDGANGDIWIQI